MCLEKRGEVACIGEKLGVCVLACGDPEFCEVVGRTPGNIWGKQVGQPLEGRKE